MYFKEKEDTNIDSEFKNNKKFSFNFKKLNLKTILIIGGIIALLLIMIIIFISLSGNSSSNYRIELSGSDSIIMNLGDDYLEPGYKAYDKNDNDVTDLVEVTNNVDTSKIGEYEVLYSIGSINKVRYVTVAKSIDDTLIYLNGKVNMYLEVGEKYTEPGYEAYDSTGENLTSKVKVTGSVNTNKVGTYELTYSVVNSRNVTVTKKRTITVVEKGQKP